MIRRRRWWREGGRRESTRTEHHAAEEHAAGPCRAAVAEPFVLFDDSNRTAEHSAGCVDSFDSNVRCLDEALSHDWVRGGQQQADR